jgi:hypothetical protein
LFVKESRGQGVKGSRGQGVKGPSPTVQVSFPGIPTSHRVREGSKSPDSLMMYVATRCSSPVQVRLCIPTLVIFPSGIQALLPHKVSFYPRFAVVEFPWRLSGKVRTSPRLCGCSHHLSDTPFIFPPRAVTLTRVLGRLLTSLGQPNLSKVEVYF